MPVLIWGGAGGLGSMAIQIAKAAGAIPVAVVSGDDKIDYCMKLGAQGLHRPPQVRPLGHAAALEGHRRLQQVAEGRARLRRGDLGGAGREARARRSIFEHPGESTIPTSMFVCDTGGMVVICAGTTGYNATVDLRYLWMRQKRFQGSHFANDEQCYAMNELALAGKVDPCMSRAFTYEELPRQPPAHARQQAPARQHGGADRRARFRPRQVRGGAGRGQRGDAAEGRSSRAQARHPYPVSAPLPERRAASGGARNPRRRHARCAIACIPASSPARRADDIGRSGKTMIDNDIHALVVIEGDRAVGVLSQTDIVLARQGRTIEDARRSRWAR